MLKKSQGIQYIREMAVNSSILSRPKLKLSWKVGWKPSYPLYKLMIKNVFLWHNSNCANLFDSMLFVWLVELSWGFNVLTKSLVGIILVGVLMIQAFHR